MLAARLASVGGDVPVSLERASGLVVLVRLASVGGLIALRGRRLPIVVWGVTEMLRGIAPSAISTIASLPRGAVALMRRFAIGDSMGSSVTGSLRARRGTLSTLAAISVACEHVSFVKDICMEGAHLWKSC